MKSLIASAFAGVFALAAMATAADVGKPAPDFKAKDASGKEVSLAELKGKVVVLEWNNFECPFVKKHYDSGNLQKLQTAYTGKGVVWLTVNSGAEGKQGTLSASAAQEAISKHKVKSSHYILDTDGAVGKAYDAKTTPHIFVIGKDGTLVYNGAIDSKSTTKVEDIASSESYVSAAADAALAGKPVTTAKTEPYGCGVKY